MKLGLTYHLAFDFERSQQAYAEGFNLWQQVGEKQPSTSLPLAPHALRINWHDPESLDPTRPQTRWVAGLVSQLFSGLVALTPELDVIPEIAYRWDISDEGKKYTFHLRSDVYWSDGVPVTAEDFEYAWKRALASPSHSFAALLLQDIKGAAVYQQDPAPASVQVAVHAFDSTTLTVELEGPTNYFPHLLTYPTTYPVPRHKVERYGSNWAHPEHLVTNGPFRLETWQPDEMILLRRNPAYHQPLKGNVEEIEIILQTDPIVLLQLYQANALDLLHLWLFTAAEIDQVRQQYTSDYLVGPQLLTDFLWYNKLTKPPFDDVRVRQAFALAVDKNSLANVNLGGYVFPASGSFTPPGIPGYVDGIGTPYAPEQARQLLAEAGYPEGRDFPVVEALCRPEDESVARFLQASWQEALNVEIAWQTVLPTTFFERLESGSPHLTLVGWVADYPDPDCYLRICVMENTAAQWNNKSYEDLVNRARRVISHQERMQLYQQAERLLAMEQPVMPLTYGRNHVLLKPWLKRYYLSMMKGQFWKDVIIEPH